MNLDAVNIDVDRFWVYEFRTYSMLRLWEPMRVELEQFEFINLNFVNLQAHRGVELHEFWGYERRSLSESLIVELNPSGRKAIWHGLTLIIVENYVTGFEIS